MTSTNIKRRVGAFGAAALALVAFSLAAAPAPAEATFGDLTYRGCVGNQTNPDCAPASGPLLDGASSVAVGPAGDSVYVASFDAAAFSVFSRDGAGALSFRDCASSAALGPCDDLAGIPLQRTAGVAVSPDGGSVYTLGLTVKTVLGFASDPAAGLGPGRCLASEASVATTGCTALANQPMQEPGDLTVSPDGTSLYVVSRANNSIAHFVRALDGQLTFGGCDARTAINGCDPIPGGPLLFPQQVVVTPDGRFVYVTGFTSDSILRFARQPTGQLTFDGCLTSDPATNCQLLPGQLLDGARALEISPDGRFLYVGSFSGALVQFSLGDTGQLTLVSCLIDGAPAAGCDGTPGASLNFLRSLAISPDGRSLYAVGEEGDALAHLARDPQTGRLTFASCSIGAPLPGEGHCVDLPGEPLRTLRDVAVSPDGASVYGVDSDADSILVFARSLGDPPAPEQPSDPGQPGPGQAGPDRPGPDRPRPDRPGPDGPGPDQSGARCGGKPVSIVGTPRKDTLRGTPRRDVIAGLGGADTIRGRGGKDLICGGAGKDRLLGGAGKDTVLGGGGSDRCEGGPGRDRVACERGRGRRG